MLTTTEQLLQQFKALADPVRARLVMLCSLGECSVSELTGVTSLSQPRVSQHVKQLCDVGLMERFRDGHYVYYRVPVRGSSLQRRLLALLPDDEPQFRRDFEKLKSLRAATGARAEVRVNEADRSLHRALVELTVVAPLGDLLDVGCGQGRILKLLASRAQRAVGVDIDSDARRLARAELLLAGLPNCSLRQGSMYSLPFGDEEFDTIILDDVLGEAEQPDAALAEAQRLLRPGGRLVLLSRYDGETVASGEQQLSSWSAAAGLRLAKPRRIPARNPNWLLAVATRGAESEAA
ncbi:MAG: metalloregulator ArsR/SmtB family transcription factor [Woeseiaceae bacterium]|nr:metalloregulator ArsR/SmtB family transcription factor [Woeseiaceae bacterium]